MSERGGTVVVDASVALKWAVTEPGSVEANRLLVDRTLLVAPEHLLGEVGSGLRKRVAQRVLAPADALEALAAIHASGLEFVSGADRWRNTLRDALAWGVTTYDALYVGVAVDLGVQLVTADLRLLTAATAGRLPVRGLGQRDG